MLTTVFRRVIFVQFAAILKLLVYYVKSFANTTRIIH